MIDFIPFIGIVELPHKQTCIVLHEEKSKQNCHTTSPAHLATFYFSSRYLISRSSSTCILELTIQNTMKDQQICNIISSRVILSDGYRHYCGLFLSEMTEK